MNFKRTPRSPDRDPPPPLPANSSILHKGHCHHHTASHHPSVSASARTAAVDSTRLHHISDESLFLGAPFYSSTSTCLVHHMTTPNLASDAKNEPRTVGLLRATHLSAQVTNTLTDRISSFQSHLTSKLSIPSHSNPVSYPFSAQAHAHAHDKTIIGSGISRSRSAQDLSSLIRTRGDSWSSEYSNVSTTSNVSNQSGGSFLDGEEIGFEVYAEPFTFFNEK